MRDRNNLIGEFIRVSLFFLALTLLGMTLMAVLSHAAPVPCSLGGCEPSPFPAPVQR